MTSWVRTRAPVRVLDAGGWTDTWFAAHGSVCHLAVGPGAEVLARRLPPESAGTTTVQLHLPAFDDHYSFALDQPPGRHAMLEAALRRWAPGNCSCEVTLSSPVPPGSSLGTSASVVVALISSLQALGGGAPVVARVAQSAHEVETIDLGLQSGVQDQVAAAFGGANFVSISPYPHFEVRQLDVPPETWAALGRRVVTVYLGARHDSSAIHDSVIERLVGTSASASGGHKADGTEALMAPLRDAAGKAAAALEAGDLEAYGEAMIANTEAQAALHPALLSPLAREVIEMARRGGAIGWKVNGAGGHGWSVSVLGPEDYAELQAVLEKFEALTLLALQPSPKGVEVVDGE